MLGGGCTPMAGGSSWRTAERVRACCTRCREWEAGHLLAPARLPLPAAVLCFMVGPLGLLCHLLTKAAVQRWRGRGQQQEYVVYRF